jgi:two-component system CheB/CheR fusion protein
MKKQSNLQDKKPKKVKAASIAVKVKPASKAERVRPKASSRSAASQFPIVGIGASAGGLEALELFLKNVPAASGLAFVIIQHMDPTYKGILVELLGRITPMKVIQVIDHTRIQPDCVYVIPPNKDMSILRGVLLLLDPISPRGLRLPINFFFRSLADDRREHSIGVILSGMGSDGTLGLRAIKEKDGVTFVQDPASAKFDGMPRSAIDTGLADVVAPPEELAGKIIRYLSNTPYRIARSSLTMSDKDQSGVAKVILLLRTQTGQDFSLYKKSTIYRRIERRMSLHQLRRIADYARYLQENPQETELLFKELLIGVTSFFRDPAVWEQLKTEVIPALLKARPNGGTLRAWVPGCSTGEEAYSLAMIFRETQNNMKSTAIYSLQIFATDLSREAIDHARTGVYPDNIIADVGEERLRLFFVKEERGYRVNKEIRDMVIFAPQNLIMDPPFTKLDLLSCRNLLIYLQAELQKKLLPLFYYILNQDGILVLGSSETIGAATELFAPLPGKTRLYRRKDTAGRMEPVEFPAAFSRSRGWAEASVPVPLTPAPNLQALTDSLLLSRYFPAAVLTTGKGDIVYVSGKTGKYLEPAAGKANLNLFAMARQSH